MSLADVYVSEFRNATNPKPARSASIEEILVGIRDGRWRKQIERLREILAREGKEAYNAAKKDLPAVTFAGEFTKRANNALVKHSGYICLDVDDLDDPDQLREVREKVIADPYTVWVFVSPSNAGLKIGLRIPEAKDAAEHCLIYESIQQYYLEVLGLEIDLPGKDVARLCFVSWDPDVFVRITADPYPLEIEGERAFRRAKPKDRPQAQGSVIEAFNAAHSIEEMLERQGYARKGNRYIRPGGSSPSVQITGGKSFHHSSSDLLHGTHLVDPFDVYAAFEHAGSITDAVKAAAVELGINKSKNPHKRASGAQKNADVRGAKTAGGEGAPPPAPSSPQPDESVRSSEDEGYFWAVDWKGARDPKPVLGVKHDLLLKHLGKRGYSKLYSPGQQESVFVQVGEHVAEQVSPEMIRDAVMRYVEALPTWLPGCGENYIHRDRLREHLIRGANIYFAAPPLQCMPPVTPNFIRDTKDSVYFFYRNGYREITRDGDAFLPYTDLGGVIWKRQQIPREYAPADIMPGDFERFIGLISNGDEERILALRTAIGYLLTRYKNPACAKAIVLLDEKISDEPDGRSGKSLLATALGKMRNVLTIDGKMVNVTNQFSFQSLELDTDVMVMDDIPKKFFFEQLFHMITGDLEFERKGKQRIIMPFEDAPKFLITTNYQITESGGSAEDRREEYELHPHFSPSYRPVDEFGRVLFNDWDDAEWSRFDDFMAGCVSLYLVNGLIGPKAVNSNRRKLLQATSKDFVEWFDRQVEEGEVKGDWRVKNALFNEFIGACPDWKKMEDRGKFSRHTFSRWLSSYARYSGLTLSEKVIWVDNKAERGVKFA